jgi:ribA/ribD-fused uncharacterized protein
MLKRKRDDTTSSCASPSASHAPKKSKPLAELEPVRFFARSADPTARALSNFALVWFECDARWYASVEHFYQSRKFAPGATRDAFSSTARGVAPRIGLDARVARTVGSKVVMKRYRAARACDWDAVLVMRDALALKFAQDDFRALLRSTGTRALHHFEHPPGFWGCYTDAQTGAIKCGSNTLGALLEELRAQLVEAPASAPEPAPTHHWALLTAKYSHAEHGVCMVTLPLACESRADRRAKRESEWCDAAQLFASFDASNACWTRHTAVRDLAFRGYSAYDPPPTAWYTVEEAEADVDGS